MLPDLYNRKKTSLWHGTVAGTLSSGCPLVFTSGAKELGENGWWRLTEMKPPYIKHGEAIVMKYWFPISKLKYLQ